MALEAPESGYVWLHVSHREAVDVVVVGEVHTWWTHWTGFPGGKLSQAVRCVRAEVGECAWCEAAHERRARYVIPVMLGEDLRLLEVGRVQYPILSLLVQEPGWIGRRLKIAKSDARKNATITLRPVGREHVSAEMVIDIEDFVYDLGRGQLALMRVPQVASPSKPRSGPVSSGAAPSGSPTGLRAVPKP